MPIETRRWFNPHQPQTLQIAVMLLYVHAVFGLIYGTIFYGIGFLFVVGSAAAGFGIANEKKWGYWLGVAMAFMPFGLRLAAGASLAGGSLINLMFEVALVALLLHTMSREYVRVWFR
ncbi:MAG: hypothetical protein AB7L13_04920 [Acidimicrobiia bacterium]